MQPSIPWNSVFVFVTEKRKSSVLWCVLCRFHLFYQLLSLTVTYCHSLSFVVTLCHSLSIVLPFVVTPCHSLYHSSSFVATRCHTPQLVVPLVATRCTTRLSLYKWTSEERHDSWYVKIMTGFKKQNWRNWCFSK